MTTEAGGRFVPPDDPAAWTRALRLGKAASRRIRSVTKGLYVAGGISLAVGGVAHGAGADILIANAIGVATAAGLVALASLPFRDPDLRSATELVADHQVRELAEWKRETGTRMPRGRPAIREWLEKHPDTPGRGSLLTVIGRFVEADAYWERHPGKTPADAFAVEVSRETAALLSGQVPALERLHELWQALPDTPERGHRRECLALLEAEAGVDGGRDPIAVLAAARSEAGEVTRSARPSSMIAVNFLLPVAVLLVITGLRLMLQA